MEVGKGDPDGIRFELDSRFSLESTAASLLSFEFGGGWETRRWWVSAVLGDGSRYRLREFGDEAAARQAVGAYVGQLSNHSLVDWARSKGFAELAEALEAGGS